MSMTIEQLNADADVFRAAVAAYSDAQIAVDLAQEALAGLIVTRDELLALRDGKLNALIVSAKEFVASE